MLLVGWTLNYEMMFYLVAAISLVLMRRDRLLFASALIFVIFFRGERVGFTLRDC